MLLCAGRRAEALVSSLAVCAVMRCYTLAVQDLASVLLAW